MKRKIGKWVSMGMALVFLIMAPMQAVKAASASEPYMAMSLSTSSSYTYMSIGTDTAKLKFNHISQQVYATDYTRTKSPQKIWDATNASYLSYTFSPETGYIYVNATCYYYVNGTRMGSTYRYLS